MIPLGRKLFALFPFSPFQAGLEAARKPFVGQEEVEEKEEERIFLLLGPRERFAYRVLYIR